VDFAAPNSANFQKIESMLLNLALNHTVLIEKPQPDAQLMDTAA